MGEIIDIKSDWRVSRDVQAALLDHLSTELEVAKRNNEKVNEDFQTFYNMIHSIRNKKPNEWEADISLPEFLSRLLTQVGNFVMQYFGSTDYVECDLDSDDAQDLAEGKAAKKLLNSILKDPDAYYYHKIVRLITYVFTCGYGIVKGGYMQQTHSEFSHMNPRSEAALHPETGGYLATDGTPFVDPVFQSVQFNTVEEPVYVDKVDVDKPVFDVWPNQCVYQSPEYAYSLNDKEYVIFETEKALSQLKAEAPDMGYFNLEALENEEPAGKRGESTYNSQDAAEEQPQPVDKTFVLFERWGKYPAIEKDGEYVPGIGADGKWKDGSELVECIIHYVQHPGNDSPRHIIGFRKSRHTRRPMTKFLCYVDMINDNGFGDGEVNRELQIAIDDNFNIGAYRTMMAAMPSFKGKKFAGVPEKVKLGPQHVTMLENMQDLEQWLIVDNPQGTGYQHNLLASRMDYAMSTSPQTMGMTSERAETATVASITNSRANIRIGMKSMNLEFIGFSDFYRDVIMGQCNDFMLPETLENIIGKDLAKYYNPERKDRFRPVSQALETEESKQYNIKSLQSVIGMVAPMQNPKTPMMINMLVGEILEAMGKKYKLYKKFMLEEDPQAIAIYQILTGGKGTGSPPAGSGLPPLQNQAGLPQSQTEQQTRMMANG